MKEKAKQIFSIIKKVLWGIIWGVFGILAITLIWLSVDKFILKSPVPSFLGYSTLTIETGSMNGFSAMVDGGTPKQVSIGDLILIKKTNDYKIGDVITFLPEGDKIPTTHRIIGYTEDGFVTKGDANNVKDTVPISKDRVLGEVIGHYPQLGKFSSWVKQEGWLYLVSGLAILGLGGFILKSDDEEDEDALALQGATNGSCESGEDINNETNAENNIENNIENPAEEISDNNSDIES
jgi:signal peptidase